jgi:hypothetical protein
MWIYSVSKLKCSSCYSKPPASAGGAFTFSKRDGRRLVLSVVVSGVMTFALRFMQSGIEAAHLVLLQAMIFPFMVLMT